MSTTCINLAQALPGDVLASSWRNMNHSTRDIFALLTAVAALSLLFLIWALFIRKRRKGISGWHFQNSSGSSTGGQSHAHGRRRRRRPHRPRNPTLAETGGLPPLRSEHTLENVP